MSMVKYIVGKGF